MSSCCQSLNRIFGLAISLGIFFSPNVIGQDVIVPASTPQGIMLVEVHQEEGFSSDPYFWTRLGDSAGKTLFYSEESKSSDEFRPVIAQDDPLPFDDWSLVPHGNFVQWAYQGHPLFTWVGEGEPGEVALNAAVYELSPENLIETDMLLPPKGWQVSRFTPDISKNTPAGFDLKLVDSAQSVVLTDHQGFSIYSYSNDEESPDNACALKDCYEYWLPVAAPALARGFDDFSVLDRADGTRQWALRERPLFTFKGDLLPGDVHGRREHVYMGLARFSRAFSPEGVNVASLPGYGDILTLNGKTLYFGSAFEKYWGGRNLRGSFDIAYQKGKRLGGQACVDKACLEAWSPFLAPVGSRSNGFWEVIVREDGREQWAYKGFAVYTYTDDEADGDMRGHSLYDIGQIDGDAEAVARTKMLAEVGNATGGAGIYWSVVKP